MQTSVTIVSECGNPRSTIVENLNDACVALFSDYGLSLLPSNISEDDSNSSCTGGLGLVALISMTNPSVRLSIALQTQRDVLEASFPSEENVADDHALQDWIGELSNQLSGRIKIKLVAFGCRLDLGPTVIQGENLHLDLPRRSEISRHSFTTESGQVILLSLSTLIEPGFTLCEPDTIQVEESLDEGEMLFFRLELE